MSIYEHPVYAHLHRDADRMIAECRDDVADIDDVDYARIHAFAVAALAGIRPIRTTPYDWAKEER